MKKLSFNLKGSRDYIQGPDVYNELSKILQDKKLSYFELSFHKIMKNNILLSGQKPKDDKELYFLCRYKENSELKELYGLKDEDSKPSKSVPYEEELIINKAEFKEEEKSIILHEQSKFSMMEEIIALNKYLVQKTIQKQRQGKWYFAKFTSSCLLPQRAYPIKIQLKTNFNFLLSKSEITIYKDSLATGGGILFFGCKGI